LSAQQSDPVRASPGFLAIPPRIGAKWGWSGTRSKLKNLRGVEVYAAMDELAWLEIVNDQMMQGGDDGI
jgi:hypothetical protein